MAPRRLLRLLSASAIILASFLPAARSQNVKKIVIHVPYKVHNMHHTHTVYRYISPKAVEPNTNYEVYESPPSAEQHKHKKAPGNHHHHLHHHVHKHKHQHEHKGHGHKGAGHDHKGHSGHEHKGHGGHDHKGHGGHAHKGGGHDHKGGGHDHKGGGHDHKGGGHDHKGHGGHAHKGGGHDHKGGGHDHKGHGGHDHKGHGGHAHKGGGHDHKGGHGHKGHGGHDHKGGGHDHKGHGGHDHKGHGGHDHKGHDKKQGHHPQGHGHVHGHGHGHGHGKGHEHGHKDCHHDKHGHDKHGHDKGHLHYYTTFIVGQDGVVPEQAPHVEYVNREYDGAQQYIVPVAEYSEAPENEETQGENYNYEDYDESQKVVDAVRPADDIIQANNEVIREVPAPIMTSPTYITPIADRYDKPTIQQIRSSPLHHPEKRGTLTKKLVNPDLERKGVQIYKLIEPNSEDSKPTSKFVKHISSQIKSLKWRMT